MTNLLDMKYPQALVQSKICAFTCAAQLQEGGSLLHVFLDAALKLKLME